MLEDHAGDVLRKALTGLGVSVADAAAGAGLSFEKATSFIDGDFDADVARELAASTGLDRQALVSLPDYLPGPLVVDGVRRIDLPFGPYRVNAWLLETRDTCVLVDAGLDAELLLDALDGYAARPDAVLITHGHRDHTGGLDALLRNGVKAMGWDVDGAESIAPGESREVGDILFQTYDLSGHCTPALGYLFHGFTHPVLAVGDAVFAGSIGGCKSPESYQLALDRIRAVFAGLPDETLILPGHGPATTWGEERVRNPFLAGW